MRSRSPARTARIRFLTTAEGGRLSAPLSGTRSQLEIGDVMTSCVLTRVDGADTLALGEDVDVFVELHFPERFELEFRTLRGVRLFEGNKLVATGAFIEDADEEPDSV